MAITTNFETLELDARTGVSLSKDSCRSYSAINGLDGAKWKDYSLSVGFLQNLENDKHSFFEVSDELANILLSNGFTETTRKDYPEQWKEYQKSSWEAGKYKRAFQLKKLTLRFDYINITIWYGPFMLGTRKRSQISKDELKALLILANCSSSLRSEYFRNALRHPSPESTRLQFISTLKTHSTVRPKKYKRILGDMYLGFDFNAE